jgi:hypothetical protein
MARVGLLLCLLIAIHGRDGRADSVAPPPNAAPAKASDPVPAKAPAPRPVKQMTRAQLEAEVVKLRAENAKMRSELDAMLAHERERVERLKQEQQKLNTKLRD